MENAKLAEQTYSALSLLLGEIILKDLTPTNLSTVFEVRPVANFGGSSLCNNHVGRKDHVPAVPILHAISEITAHYKRDYTIKSLAGNCQ